MWGEGTKRSGDKVLSKVHRTTERRTSFDYRSTVTPAANPESSATPVKIEAGLRDMAPLPLKGMYDGVGVLLG